MIELIMTPILDISNLTVTFRGKNSVHVLNGVNLQLYENEILGLLGESGSGKSMLLRSIMQLLPPGASVTNGKIIYKGKDLSTYNMQQMRGLLGKEIALVSQEPGLSLDPVYKIGHQLIEMIVQHLGVSRRAARRRAHDLLNMVRLPRADACLEMYPHEMSGGMKQRVSIGLAIACEPTLLLADEPTTALDVTIQLEILGLLKDIQRELGMGVIFVTHDTGVWKAVCDSIAVMYGGLILESGVTKELIENPYHPYFHALMGASVNTHSPGEILTTIRGDPPIIRDELKFCPFVNRCDYAVESCRVGVPRLVSFTGLRREVRCVHYYDGDRSTELFQSD